MADPDPRPVVGASFWDEVAAAGLTDIPIAVSGNRLNVSPDVQGPQLAALKTLLGKHDASKRKTVMIPFDILAARIDAEGLWDKLVDAKFPPGKAVDATGGAFLKLALRRGQVRADNPQLRQWLTEAGAKPDQIDRIFADPPG